MKDGARGNNGDIIDRAEFEHATVVAEKLELIRPIMDDDEKEV